MGYFEDLKARVDAMEVHPHVKAQVRQMIHEARAIGVGEGYIDGYMEGIVDGGDPDGSGDRVLSPGGPGSSPLSGEAGIPGGPFEPVPAAPAPAGIEYEQPRAWDYPVGGGGITTPAPTFSPHPDGFWDRTP